MASARNEALKGVGCPLPTREESGEGAIPDFSLDFFKAQNGKFWCILGANFIAVELSYTHTPVSLDIGL